MTNKQLKEALLKKLQITSQALWQRCQKLKIQVPMTTEDATYIIAQRNGITLDKYLDEETLNKVRNLLQRTTMPSQSLQESHGKISKSVSRQYVVKIGKNFQLTDPLLPRKKITEAKEMADVYPLIYILENSIRELIDRVMTAQFDNNWWNSQASKHLRKDVSDRMADDKKNSWHQRRGARPIDYLDLKDLPRLMRKIEKIVVPDIIPSMEWFSQLVDEVYKSRCVVCHMNPLDKNNIQAVQVRFNHWQKQIDAKKSLIA